MTNRTCPVRIDSPQGEREILAKTDDQTARLSEWLQRQGFPLNTRCGQRGLCDGCVIELVEGKVTPLDGGEPLHVAPNANPVSFQSCVYRFNSDAPISLRIPERAMMAYEPRIVDEFRINVPRAHQPLWDAADDNDVPPSQDRPALAAAIDIGTTTVALLLVDLASGEILARASSFNQQILLADDVLTRINLCMHDKTLIERMQESVVNQTISELLNDALRHANSARDQVVCLAAAGNTTMLHLLAGVDPTSLGTAPFTPQFLDHRVLPVSTLDFRWPMSKQPEAPSIDQRDPAIHLLPSAGAYIGADLTAGVVATGLLFDDGPTLLVDVGTNGEIILKHNEHLLACATAAGPAFEGGRLTDGIRAGHGAIDHIRINTEPFDVEADVIGRDKEPKLKPIGLCGSAYIDFMEQGVASGLLDITGRFHKEAVPADSDRFNKIAKCHGNCFRVAWGKGKDPLIVSESDIASLLQAKAAIAAGILTLLDRVNLTPADIKTLYLAGGFGMHVDIQSAIGCGLLPGFKPEQIELVGNTSLAGAYLALLDRTVIDEMAHACDRMDVVELNLEPGFEDRYIDQLLLG